MAAAAAAPAPAEGGYVPPKEKHMNTMPGLFNQFANKLSGAAYYQNTEEVIKCLEAGESVEAKDALNQTALIYGVRNGADTEDGAKRVADIAKLLLDAGANPNKPDKYGDTPLILCIMDGGGDIPKVAAVEVLIKGGADVHKVCENFKMTPLHWSAVVGSTAIAKILVANGARINKIDRQRKTALKIAQDCLKRLEDNLDHMGEEWDEEKRGKKAPLMKKYKAYIAYIEPLTSSQFKD